VRGGGYLLIISIEEPTFILTTFVRRERTEIYTMYISLKQQLQASEDRQGQVFPSPLLKKSCDL
jgi:hypothetical protein